MEDTKSELSPQDAAFLELGANLGRNQAFAVVAGRCSAAQAESMRRLRDSKAYAKTNLTWRQFCPRYLGMSGSQADRIIQLLEKHGPGYFDLAQLTRISEETYRVLEPSVKDGALYFRGEAIELHTQNTHRLALAVAELRREASDLKPKRPDPVLSAVDGLSRRVAEIIQEIEEVAARGGESWIQFAADAAKLSNFLIRVAREYHI